MVKKQKELGITLIALVVTIVILIILATISVNMVFGDNGLIAKARDAREHQTNAVEWDTQEIGRLEEEYNNSLVEEYIKTTDIEFIGCRLEVTDTTAKWELRYRSDYPIKISDVLMNLQTRGIYEGTYDGEEYWSDDGEWEDIELPEECLAIENGNIYVITVPDQSWVTRLYELYIEHEQSGTSSGTNAQFVIQNEAGSKTIIKIEEIFKEKRNIPGRREWS